MIRLKAQFKGRVPKVTVEIHDLIIFDFDAFFFKAVLHLRRSFEVMFSGKKANAIDNSMSGDALWTTVHGPAHHARAGLSAEIVSNSPVSGDPPFRNEANYLVNVFEKISMYVLCVRRHN